jgi:hypothetical protein
MDNKYDKFYQDVKRFLHQTGIASENEIEGTSIVEIERCGIIIPMAIKKYFEFFGERFNPEGFVLSTYPFKIFLKANSILKRDTYAKGIMAEYFSHYLPFQRDDFRNGFDFCDQNEENPNNLLMEDYDVYNVGYQSFTNLVRGHLFQSISFKFYSLDKDVLSEKRERYNRIKLEPLKWTDYYCNKFHTQEYQLKNGLSANTWHNHRRDFYKLIAEEEAKGDFLYSIDEFEMKFIEYLKSKIGDI